MDLGLAGKVVIVTGATANIGRGIALALAAAGTEAGAGDCRASAPAAGAEALNPTISAGTNSVFIKVLARGWNVSGLMASSCLF